MASTNLEVRHLAFKEEAARAKLLAKENHELIALLHEFADGPNRFFSLYETGRRLGTTTLLLSWLAERTESSVYYARAAQHSKEAKELYAHFKGTCNLDRSCNPVFRARRSRHACRRHSERLFVAEDLSADFHALSMHRDWLLGDEGKPICITGCKKVVLAVRFYGEIEIDDADPPRNSGCVWTNSSQTRKVFVS